MKKTLTILLALSFLVSILAACDRTAEPEIASTPDPTGIFGFTEIPEPEYDSDSENETETETENDSLYLDGNSFGLTISLASEELLNTFDYLHEADYTLLRGDFADDVFEYFNGDRLVIRADVPLYDLALISIANDVLDDLDDRVVFAPVNAFGQIEVLLPGQAFVINSYVGLGTLPASGISFVSESGERHYFWMLEDQSVNIYPNPFSDADFLDRFDDYGALQIQVTRDGRESRYITVTLDEIGSVSPADWFIGNQHLWRSFFLLEFENPVD